MSEQREPAGGEVSGQEASSGGEASVQSAPAGSEASEQPAPAGGEASELGVAGGDEASGQEASAEGEAASQSAPEGDVRPEERLERAVRAAEQALIEFEIAVETFRVEVDNFSRLHHQKLGPMYSRLDELEAEIAEARAARTGDPEDVRKAHEARARVMPMPGVEELFHGWMDSEGLFPEAVAMLTDQPVRPPQRVRPSEEARKLYRELARKAHPDLAQDEDERKRRDEFIARVNAAYGRGDEALLRELSAEWAAGPVPEEWKPTRSEELYARLEWLAQRKEMLAFVAQELEESAIGAMLKLAPDDPDRLLEEIAEQLLAQVGEREAELAALIAQAQ
ncbi:J domain-containing protein [Streptomyces sp. 142MFCol3.1]|uniref:J domain-containing protein n=1 Tax=Streptomyces sp. 142MFCol3.1 TaxID=1172179 RepID=UPI003B640D35